MDTKTFLATFVPALAVLAIWDIAWKGVALWKAAHNRDKTWFVILLIINSVGVLPILYIYLFGRQSSTRK